jgi:hypothetical protein
MREPDLKGKAAKAWNLRLVRTRPDHEGCLAGWLVHAPYSHPIWPWKQISVIHLRDIPGVKPAVKHYAEAEYEFSIVSINPEECPHPDPDEVAEGYPSLIPPDVIAQFDVKGSDHDAVRVCESAIRAIVNGVMVPDVDYRAVWKQAVEGTAKHFRTGAHIES